MKINLFLTVIFLALFTSSAQAQQTVPTANSSTLSEPHFKKGYNPNKVVADDPDFFSKYSFGALFYSLGGYDDAQFRNPDPSFAIYDAYVGLSWRVPYDVRLSLLPTFGYTTSGYDFIGNQTADKFYWRDFSIAAAQNHLLEDFLPAKWGLKQKARLYLPTSDGSKAEGMIARLRLEFETRYNIDRYSSVRAYVKPSYYFQRNTSYLTSGGKIRTTKMIDSEHGAELSWDLNRYFSAKPGFEIQEQWTNKSDVNFRDGRHDSVIGYRMGLEIRPNRDMNFTVGMQETHDLISPSNAPEVGYTLLTNITLL